MWRNTRSPRRSARAELRVRAIASLAGRGAAPRHGFTLIEVLVGIAIMAVVGGAISILVGTAMQSKLITSVRSSNTETARSALEWMTERIRNGGLNLQPSAQTQLRCKDMVVAQDPVLLPTTTSVYVSGDMLNTVTGPPYPDATIGYYLGSDPVTGATVVMEYKQACSGGATLVAGNSTPLTSPKLTITGLSFQYFDATGATVSNLATPASIRKIRIIGITLSVRGNEGSSGFQNQTLMRFVMLRNPEANANNWVDVNENY